MMKPTFPNDLGNYPGKRKPQPDPIALTARERFHRLCATFATYARLSVEIFEVNMHRIIEISHELIALVKEIMPVATALYAGFLHWRSRQHSKQLKHLPGKPKPKVKVKS